MHPYFLLPFSLLLFAPRKKALAIALSGALYVALLTSADENNSANTIVISYSHIEQPTEEIGTSVTLLTEQDIQQSAYTQLSDLLRTVGSVGVSNNGGPGLTPMI